MLGMFIESGAASVLTAENDLVRIILFISKGSMGSDSVGSIFFYSILFVFS
jgi:hypothetical protein